MAPLLIAAAMPAADAIHQRQENFKQIGASFKAVRDELKSGTPDLAAVRIATRDIVAHAALQRHLFPRGSGTESGIKTRAKADI